MRDHQRGLGGTLVAVVLILVAVVVLATLALTRATKAVERGGEVPDRFARLHEALLQYAGATERLPCPANPALDDGVEAGGGAAACTHLTGTVPWATISARRDDAIDPWGQKISYRVYTGAIGFTQVKGVSMVDCDTSDLAGPRDAAGLCMANKDTGPNVFLQGKGLSVNDQGMAHNDVAYVLISHGATGLGAFTTSGVQRELPTAGGAESTNTQGGPSFVAKAFSASELGASSVDHFDDHLAYRKSEELIRAAGLYARNWAETAAAAGTVSSVVFNQATVDAAVGSPVTPGSPVGTVSVNFLGVVASGTSGGTGGQITFDVVGAYGGLGVDGGGSSLIQSSANERLRINFPESYAKIGITLNDFGIYSGTFIEIAQLAFYSGDSLLAVTRFGVGCNSDGGLASFSTDAGGALFDRVDVIPVPALDTSIFTFTGITAFLVSEVKACTASAATCDTSLAAPANTCTAF